MTAAQCAFGAPVDLPYYWDPECTLQTPGCWADSANVECRFCGSAPYTGIPCPPEAMNVRAAAESPQAPTAAAFLAPSSAAAGPAAMTQVEHKCTFDNPPVTEYYWEPQCRQGMVGCNADNRNVQCRFCGSGVYAGIPCRPADCSFGLEPRTPYFWDEDCAMNVLGCNADGAHVQCRFCVQRPFDPVDCPASLLVEPGKCTFLGLPPTTPYFWDPSCEFGMLGCWADGLHAECRWCGTGAYQAVACPQH